MKGMHWETFYLFHFILFKGFCGVLESSNDEKGTSFFS